MRRAILLIIKKGKGRNRDPRGARQRDDGRKEKAREKRRQVRRRKRKSVNDEEKEGKK